MLVSHPVLKPSPGRAAWLLALAYSCCVFLSASSGAQWKADVSQAEVPQQPASGVVQGKSFTVDSASFENGVLWLQHQQGNGLERTVSINLFLGFGESPEKKTWRVEPKDTFRVPIVRLSLAKEGEPQGTDRVYDEKYSMYLQFAGLNDNVMTTRLYLALPDKSWVSGYLKTQLAGGPDVTSSGSSVEGEKKSGLASILDSSILDTPLLGGANGVDEADPEVVLASRQQLYQMPEEAYWNALGLNPNANAVESLSAFPIPFKALTIGALALTLVSWLWFAWAAYREHWGLGAAMLVFPLAGIPAMLVTRLKASWKPCVFLLAGLGLLYGSFVIGGVKAVESAEEAWLVEQAQIAASASATDTETD